MLLSYGFLYFRHATDVRAAMLEYFIWQKTRPKKAQEMRERAFTLSQNMTVAPRKLVQSTVSAISWHHSSPALAGLHTSSSSSQFAPVWDSAQLESQQEALAGKEHDPFVDVGSSSPTHSKWFCCTVRGLPERRLYTALVLLLFYASV